MSPIFQSIGVAGRRISQQDASEVEINEVDPGPYLSDLKVNIWTSSSYTAGVWSQSVWSDPAAVESCRPRSR